MLQWVTKVKGIGFPDEQIKEANVVYDFCGRDMSFPANTYPGQTKDI